MKQDSSTTVGDPALIAGILKHVSGDLSLLFGRELCLEAARIERAHTRATGAGQVHISFRLGFVDEDGHKRSGALLVPLPDAMTMACLLLMLPEDELAVRRLEPAPDNTLKDGMIEIGNLVGGAIKSALAELGLSKWSVTSAGCQGLRADMRPAFPYNEGNELIVARVRGRLEPFPAFELVLMLPMLA